MSQNKMLRDIPSIKKNLEDYQNLQTFKTALPVLRPLLKLFGLDTDKLDEVLSQTSQIEQLTLDLANIPDRFNDIFGERGWIIHDRMSLEIAKVAIQKAEDGNIDEAELELVDYYNPKSVKLQLQMMFSVQAFHPRMRLAEMALVDYEEERYHACVPVVLMLLDGLVNELNEKKLGFFAKDVNLEAWDSIAAHSKGLGTLTRLFQKTRRKTTSEPIAIPYRNGILHGMDLSYDNKIVAAKAWAALFAVRDWAQRVERGLLTPPPEEPSKPLWKVFEHIRENHEEIDRLKKWVPRCIRIGIDVLQTGVPDDFLSGTPEQKLAEFLMYWKKRNYGYMVRCLTVKIGKYHAKPAAEMKQIYSGKALIDFEFTRVEDRNYASTAIQTQLTYKENGNIVNKSVDFVLLNEDETGEFVTRGNPKSRWAILNWGI